MIYLAIFYIVVGILVTLLNIKADKLEGVEESEDYLFLPITWFPKMIIELFTDYDDEDRGSNMDFQ